MANAAPARAASGRLVEFDVMRGAAIVAVVYLHAYFSPWEVTPHRHVLAMHAIHLLAHTAVPVFLFMAAFLQARDRSPTFAAFQRRKVPRIYIPMLVWMCAALAYRAWQDGWDNELLRRFLLFDISGQFYYLFVLAVFFAAFFLVREWPTRRLGWLAAAAFAVNLATIVAYAYGRDLSGDYATYAYRNPLAWVFFYALGFWVSRRFGSPAFGRGPALAALALMAVAGAVYFFEGEALDSYPVSYFGVSVFLFSCGSLVVFPSLAAWVLRTPAGMGFTFPFRLLSPYAFAIYLVHMPFFVGYVTNRFVSDSVVRDDYWRLMNSLFLVGFVTALLFVVLASALLPRLAGPLLGVEKPRRRPRDEMSASDGRATRPSPRRRPAGTP